MESKTKCSENGRGAAMNSAHDFGLYVREIFAPIHLIFVQ